MRETLKAVVRLGVLVMSAGALASTGVTSAGLASACRMEPDPVFLEGGAALGYCSGFFAKPLRTGECPGCSGEAFALCNGNSFNECTCELPSEYSLDSGTFQGATPGMAAGLTPITVEAGRYPCCEGNVYREIPAFVCPAHCAGEVAYLICQGDAWTACSCEIPAGFNLPDITCDGG
jgi:hypothetical protein